MRDRNPSKRTLLTSMLATVAATACAGTLVAGGLEPMNRLGRTLGHGWGDGYHARESSGPRPGADLPPRSHSKRFDGQPMHGQFCAHRTASNYYNHIDAGQMGRANHMGLFGCGHHGCDASSCDGCDGMKHTPVDYGRSLTYVSRQRGTSRRGCDSPTCDAPGCDGQYCGAAFSSIQHHGAGMTMPPPYMMQSIPRPTSLPPVSTVPTPAYIQPPRRSSNQQPSKLPNTTPSAQPNPGPLPVQIPSPGQSVSPTPSQPIAPARSTPPTNSIEELSSPSDVTPDSTAPLQLPDVGSSEDESDDLLFEDLDSMETLPPPRDTLPPPRGHVETLPAPNPDRVPASAAETIPAPAPDPIRTTPVEPPRRVAPDDANLLDSSEDLDSNLLGDVPND